jgi:hypothetical protein
MCFGLLAKSILTRTNLEQARLRRPPAACLPGRIDLCKVTARAYS